MLWCGCGMAGAPDPSTGGIVVLEAVAHALGALLHIAGGVLRLALGLVGLALGLGPLVAGHLAGPFLHGSLDLVRRPSHDTDLLGHIHPRPTRGTTPGFQLRSPAVP